MHTAVYFFSGNDNLFRVAYFGGSEASHPVVMPAGYDQKAFLGFARNNDNMNFEPKFEQVGRRVRYLDSELEPRMTGSGCTAQSGSTHPWRPDGTTEKMHVRCCSSSGSMTECHTRDDADDCFPAAATFLEAERACADDGKRLCTQAEVMSSICCSTGCSYDTERVWTSSKESASRGTGVCQGSTATENMALFTHYVLPPIPVNLELGFTTTCSHSDVYSEAWFAGAGIAGRESGNTRSIAVFGGAGARTAATWSITTDMQTLYYAPGQREGYYCIHGY